MVTQIGSRAMHPIVTVFWRLWLVVVLSLSLVSCGWIEAWWNGSSSEDESSDSDNAELTFMAAKSLPTLPWFFAEKEELFKSYGEEYGVSIAFKESDYESAINKFISREVDAIVATNIDVISKIAVKEITCDVILITGYSAGNEAVLVPINSTADIRNKKIALPEFSVNHYLLDRYLLRNQIDFSQVTIENTKESTLQEAVGKEGIFGITASNPLVSQLTRSGGAKTLFSSRDINNEINYLLVINRESLEKHPGFGKALLATWFSIMERLQGSKRSATLDALAALEGVDRAEFEQRFAMVNLVELPARGLSTIRDRTMRKTMRHIRSFMKNHNRSAEGDISTLISYPGRTPAVLHFNAEPLQEFVAPAQGTQAQGK
jgi:NitT/TauT family transport system substrate-binding protein